MVSLALTPTSRLPLEGDTHAQILTSGGLSAALRQHVLVLQHQVGELYSRPPRQEKEDKNHTIKESTADVSPDINSDQTEGSRKRRPAGRVREIPQFKPNRIEIDYPEDSDDENTLRKLDATNVEKAQPENDAESGSSEGESESSGDDKEDILAEQWDIHSARESVQQLMGHLHLESRVDILENLQAYYDSKLLNVEKDSKTINRVEVEAQSGMDYINGAATELSQIINDREIKSYMLLWKYYKTLQQQLSGIDADYEQKRLQQVRELLIMHARESRKPGNRSSKALPQGVKPCDMLLVVSEVQKDIDSLKATIELDGKKKTSYEHTLDYILHNGLIGINNDPIASEVIQDLREWMQQGSKTDTNAQKLAKDIEGKEISYGKLMSEIEVLKTRLQEFGVEMSARNYARLQQTKSDTKIEAPKTEASASSSEVLEKKGTHALMLSTFAGPTENSHMLFNETTSKEFENDFLTQQEENMHIEKQLRQFEELEILAKSAVTTLEEGARKFADVANNAKRNLTIGVLPQEAECEDTKVLQDLKGFDEQYDRKQEEEHLAEMQALEQRESELCTQLNEIQTEIDAVTVKIAQEKKKKDAIMIEVDDVKREHKELNKELRNLNLMNPQEEQEKLNRILDENEELRQLIDGARYNIIEARRRVEVTTQAFAQSREAATRLIMTRKKDRIKLKAAASNKFGAGRKMEPHKDGGATEQEKQAEGDDGGEKSPEAIVDDMHPEGCDVAHRETAKVTDEGDERIESNIASDNEHKEKQNSSQNVEISEDQADGEQEETVADQANGGNAKQEEDQDIASNESSKAQTSRSPAQELEEHEVEDRQSPVQKPEDYEPEDCQSPTQELEVCEAEDPQSQVQESEVEEQPEAVKSRIEGWKQKLGLSPKEKIPEHIHNLMVQEQKDNKLAAQFKAKSAEINRQIAAIEDWVRKSKGVDIKTMLDAEEQKIEDDVPAELLSLRQQTKKQKKTLQALRMHWYNVRELAKRGGKAHGGKEAAELRLAILRICEDALAYNRGEAAEGQESPPSLASPLASRRSVLDSRMSLSGSPGRVARSSSVVSTRSSYVGNVDRKSSAVAARESFRGRRMNRMKTEPEFRFVEAPSEGVRQSFQRKGTFS